MGQKDVSTRRIKPTLPDVSVVEVLNYVANWNPEWEYDGSIQIYDEGIAQYLLVGYESHKKFFASLILGKPSLRCTLVTHEPNDILENSAENTLKYVTTRPLTDSETRSLTILKDILGKRGFHHTYEEQ